MVSGTTPWQVDRLRKDTGVRWDRQWSHSPTSIGWESFLWYVSLFGLAVALAALHIVMSFYARELALERLAVQKSAEKCLKKIERLETEFRMIVDSAALQEAGCMHFGLASMQPAQRRNVIMDQAIEKRYEGPANGHQIALTDSSGGRGNLFIERILDRSGLAGRVFASEHSMSSEGR